MKESYGVIGKSYSCIKDTVNPHIKGVDDLICRRRLLRRWIHCLKVLLRLKSKK